MKGLYKPAVFGCALLWLVTSTLRAEVEVPIADNLLSDGQLAHSKQLPILLTFSAIECSYCDLLEEEFLQPMLLGGEYSEKIIIRKLVLDNGSRVADFTGQRIDVTRLSDRYRVYVTPTILFVDENGTELAERMVGINTLELFGGYLDDCIETAWQILRLHAVSENLPGCRLQPPSKRSGP